MTRLPAYGVAGLLVLRATCVLAGHVARKEAVITPVGEVEKPVARKEAAAVHTSANGDVHHTARSDSPHHAAHHHSAAHKHVVADSSHHAAHHSSDHNKHAYVHVHAGGSASVTKDIDGDGDDGYEVEKNRVGAGSSSVLDTSALESSFSRKSSSRRRGGDGDGDGDGGDGDGDGDGDFDASDQNDAVGDGSPTGGEVTATGYMVDITCYHRSRAGLEIPDSTDPRTSPQDHTVGCMLAEQCRTYYIVRNTGTAAAPNYRAEWKLDDVGNALAVEMLTNMSARTGDEAKTNNITVTAVGTVGTNPGDLNVKSLVECITNCDPEPSPALDGTIAERAYDLLGPKDEETKSGSAQASASLYTFVLLVWQLIASW